MTEVVHAHAEVSPAPSVVTIGNFDGVHRGHQVLLRRAVDAARDRGVRSVAVTFEPHPAAVLRPGAEPPRLHTLDERIEQLVAAGVDLVLVLPFTRELSVLSPRAFVEQVLVARLQAVRVVVGTNFRFGHRAAGDVVMLVEEGERHGFETEAVTLLELGEDAVSSSALRQAVADGEVEQAAAALGRPFTLRGTVVAGDGRGRTIGVPTANLAVAPDVVVPANGVYAGRLEVGGDRYDAVTNVGVRPTFDGRSRSIEAHLLEAAVDLYDATVTLGFERRIRGEQRFDGPDELVARIREDVAEARRLLSSPS